MKKVVLNTARLSKRIDILPMGHSYTFPKLSNSGVASCNSSQGRNVRTFCVDQSTENKGSTLDSEEVEKFSRLANKWWDQRGEFVALQTLNELRVPLIRDGIAAQDLRYSEKSSSKPLEGYSILDVGCGGGILAEPLARLGATVTGIDAGNENIEAAKHHASFDPSIRNNIEYRCSLVEDLVPFGDQYDGVVASEILEHVSDVGAFLSSCCELVKPGGSIFITTINRTMLSGALAVFAAERIFKVVPVGAHDWNKFVTPEELQDILQTYGLMTRLQHGMLLNPLTLKWTWTKESPMNYALHAVKSFT